MRLFSTVLAVLAGLFGFQGEHRRRRVGYQALGEQLETRNLQGALSSGLTAPSTSHRETGKSLLGAGEVRYMKVGETTGHASAGSSGAGVRVVYHSNAAGVLNSTAAANPEPGGSGRINPRDPGGVELVQTADSGKVDPKDPGGVELGWVDHAVVDRLGRS